MEDLDHMRETFLLVASLFVMMNMASKILSLCAGFLAEMELLYTYLCTYDANIFRMLGYLYGSPTSESRFGRVSDNFAMDDVKCAGTEESLLDCPHRTRDNCGPGEAAGVICSNYGREVLQALYELGHEVYTTWKNDQVTRSRG